MPMIELSGRNRTPRAMGCPVRAAGTRRGPRGVRTHVLLPVEIFDQLADLAFRRGVSLSYQLGEIICEQIAAGGACQGGE